MPNTLIGPLKRDPNFEEIMNSYEVLGDYAASAEVLTFKPFDLLKDDNPILSFQPVLNRIPRDWSVDQVIFWGIENEYIPEDIENGDYKLIGIILDWSISFESILKNACRFDWLFTDHKGTELLKKHGIKNVSSINIKAFSPYLHRKYLYHSKKDYDIVFLGDFNKEMYQERDKWIYRLSKLSSKYKIMITNKNFGESYTELLNSSKIAFNFCRNNVINQKTFEIPACNSLLFINEGVEDISGYLKDKEDCIYYNENNFEELIDFYLNNQEEREKITKKGYQKVQRYSFEYNFENLLSEIDNLDSQEIRKNRTFEKLDGIEKALVKSTQILQSTNIGKFFIIEKELKSITESFKPNIEALNNLGVSYANGYIFLTNKEQKLLFSRAKNLLDKAIVQDPMYAIARFNLGTLYYYDQEYQKAEDVLNSVIACISSNPIESLKNKGFIYWDSNISSINEFRLKIQEAYYNSSDEESLVFSLCDTLLSKTFEMLGDINKLKMNIQQSIDMYDSSVEILDNFGHSKEKIAHVYFKDGFYDSALELYSQVTEIKPLYIEIQFKKLECLRKLGRNEDAELLKEELSTVLKVVDQKGLYSKTLVDM